MNFKISGRFVELIAEAQEIENSKFQSSEPFGNGWAINVEQFVAWKLKAKNLIDKACGKDSQHLQQFIQFENEKGIGHSYYSALKNLRAVLLASQNDFDGGYLTSMRTLVQAEVFDNELDQAKELLNSGYKAPAAVVAGVVLETAIRDLCGRHGVTHGPKDKLDKLNADLVKAGAYNVLQQKGVTQLADVRNRAAHGDHTAYTEQDVEVMISEVERFLTVHLV